MDKMQADAIADAMLQEARRRRQPQPRRVRTRSHHRGARRVLAVSGATGAVAGLGVIVFCARHVNAGVELFGAEWGAGAGVIVGWAIIWWRRLRAMRSISRRRAARFRAGWLRR